MSGMPGSAPVAKAVPSAPARGLGPELEPAGEGLGSAGSLDGVVWAPNAAGVGMDGVGRVVRVL